MGTVNLMIGITERRLAPDCEKIFGRHMAHVVFSVPASGTASNAMLEYLGMDQTEKTVFFLTVTDSALGIITKEFRKLHRFRSRNNGITAVIPISSVGGATVLQYLVKDQEEKEIGKMEKQTAELIIAISNSGCTDQVMDAARSAGARGGTVIHAKTADVKYAEQFFGVSISVEKEMVFILVRPEDKHTIMRAIMEQAGVSTKARTIVFSLPVSDVQGTTLTDEIENL